MTWIENKARFTLIEIKAYLHMYNQAYFKQLKEKHKIFQIFCMHQVYKKLSLLEFPIWGQLKKTHHSTRQIPIDLLRVLNRVASRGFVNKSAS